MRVRVIWYMFLICCVIIQLGMCESATTTNRAEAELQRCSVAAEVQAKEGGKQAKGATESGKEEERQEGKVSFLNRKTRVKRNMREERVR